LAAGLATGGLIVSIVHECRWSGTFERRLSAEASADLRWDVDEIRLVMPPPDEPEPRWYKFRESTFVVTVTVSNIGESDFSVKEVRVFNAKGKQVIKRALHGSEAQMPNGWTKQIELALEQAPEEFDSRLAGDGCSLVRSYEQRCEDRQDAGTPGKVEVYVAGKDEPATSDFTVVESYNSICTCTRGTLPITHPPADGCRLEECEGEGPPGPHVETTDIFYDGQKGRAEPDEYVELSNLGSMPVDLSGWHLISAAGNQRYDFPSGFTLEPDQVCRVYTNEDHPDWCGLKWGEATAVWRNEGDKVELYDANGVLVDEFSYGTLRD